MAHTEIQRAYRYTLDPTPAQQELLAQHAGAARWAYNFALALKKQAHQQWRDEVDALVATGVPEDEARKKAEFTRWNYVGVSAEWRRTRDLPMEQGGSPWHVNLDKYAFTNGFRDADAAWKNWMDSVTGKRAGRRVGYPRFKKKGRSRDSFRLNHNVKRPAIRLVGYRRLRLPRLGEIRLHDTAKPLARSIAAGAHIKSATIAREGHRWYASLLAVETITIPEAPTRHQRRRGTVGVDLGVKHLAALSHPLDPDDPTTCLVPNPHHLATAQRRLLKAQRALARCEKGSHRRDKARRRLARAHHEVAVRRKAAIHQLTKRLVTEFDTVVIEDLNIAGMTASAKGTVEQPGTKVRQKAGLNRSILDAALGEFRRQLDYKAPWYGTRIAVLDRWFPSSKTCSACGTVDDALTLAERTFRCPACGMVLDRDINAARNIAAHATVQ